MVDNRAVFTEIAWKAEAILSLATLAKENPKERESFMKAIMAKTEEIEELYSNNWH